MLAYIAAHLHEPLQYDRLEPDVCLDRFTIIRRVRERTGLTPRLLQHQLRIAEAQRRIRRGERLADIAQDTGFADQAHFCRVFKRLAGVTPSRYRREALRGEAA